MPKLTLPPHLRLNLLFALTAIACPVFAEESTTDSELVQLDAMSVVGSSEDKSNYNLQSISTATPLAANLLDVPFVNLGVSAGVLDDIGALEIEDAYDYVSGVNPSEGYGGVSSGQFNGRGFASGAALRNGYRDFGFLTPYDLSLVDRIEVLKGSASILYGSQTSPGLHVNIITKKALAERMAEATFTVGSYDTNGARLRSFSILEREHGGGYFSV